MFPDYQIVPIRSKTRLQLFDLSLAHSSERPEHAGAQPDVAAVLGPQLELVRSPGSTTGPAATAAELAAAAEELPDAAASLGR